MLLDRPRWGRLAKTLTAVALGLGLFTTSLTAAHADTPGCATRGEFDRVRPGMTQSRVHSLFDTRGIFMDGGAGGFVRYYANCSDGSVAIEYATTASGAPHVGSKTWLRDSPGVATTAEVRQVNRGMTRQRVHFILDTRGVVILPRGGNHPYESREYRMFRGCVGIDFDFWDGAMRVVSKYRYADCLAAG